MEEPSPRQPIDRNADIDRAATRLVANWLEPRWIIRRQNPDIYIDYEMEGREQGAPSGEKFYVQQKGTEHLSENKGVVRMRLGTAELTYYCDRVTAPVFLFVVTVIKKRGYWLFVQEWMDKHADPNWRSQGSLTLSLPKANLLKEDAPFRAAVKRGLAYMREKCPGSIDAAIRYDAKSFESIDPRFDVRIDVIGSLKRYHLNPKKPLEMQMMVQPEASGLLKDYYDFGSKFDVPASLISFSDFPLFEKLKADYPGVQFSMESTPRDCELDFYFKCMADSPRLRLRGSLVVGISGFHYVGRLKDAPLEVNFRMTRQDIKNKAPGMIALSTDLNAWAGKPLLLLPHFESLQSFTAATKTGSQVSFDLTLEGDHLTSAHLDNLHSPIASLAKILEALHQARAVSRLLGVNPILPDLYTVVQQELDTIRFLYEILVLKKHESRREDLWMSGIFDASENAALDELADETPGEFRIIESSLRRKLFGVEVDTGPVEIVLNPAALILDQNVDGTNDRPFRVKSVGLATLTIAPYVPPQSPESVPA